MPNDAKLGLVVGVGLVIVITVVFFRKDTTATANPPSESSAPTAVNPAAVNPAGMVPSPRPKIQPVPVNITALTPEPPLSAPAPITPSPVSNPAPAMAPCQN